MCKILYSLWCTPRLEVGLNSAYSISLSVKNNEEKDENKDENGEKQSQAISCAYI